MHARQGRRPSNLPVDKVPMDEEEVPKATAPPSTMSQTQEESAATSDSERVSRLEGQVTWA
jgi:hypothetical protein